MCVFALVAFMRAQTANGRGASPREEVLRTVFSAGFEKASERVCEDAGDGKTCRPGSVWAAVLPISASAYVNSGCHSGSWCGAMFWHGGSEPGINQSAFWVKSWAPVGLSSNDVYFTMWYFLPQNWRLPDHNAGNDFFKVMLFETGDPKVRGYVDFLNLDSTNTHYRPAWISSTDDTWRTAAETMTVDGKWHCLQVCINSRISKIELWLDGKLEVVSKDAGLRGRDIQEWKFGGFYNSEVHPAQTFYVDDVTVSVVDK